MAEDWTKWLTEEREQNLLQEISVSRESGYGEGLIEEVEHVLRSLAASRALVAEIREAAVIDYSKLTSTSRRVECHFCSAVWTSGQPTKHGADCPLNLTEADMLERNGCTCDGPSYQPCSLRCRFPYTDERLGAK